MKPMPSSPDQGWDADIIEILRHLGSLKAEYPSGILAARRAAFILQVQQQAANGAENDAPVDEPFLQRLQALKSINMEYPQALRAARRTAFIDQIERYHQRQVSKELDVEDQAIVRLFQNLKTVEVEYPPKLMAARRAGFIRQIALGGRVSVLDALLNSMRSLLAYKIKLPSVPAMNAMRTSLVVLVLMLATFVGSLLRSPIQPASPYFSPDGFSQPEGIFTATSTGGVARVVCKPGYLPPLCSPKALDESQDLTFQGNGARPAVSKDAFPDYSGVHKAAYANDGLYGSGKSWISNSAYSWIKIDLGKTTAINTVAFGKDRLGNYKDGDPGQFVIAVALSDNVYADGNSSNDYIEYTDVYNSAQAGFDGVVSGPETILAQFDPVTARYIKITFANPKVAVDEVQAFMLQRPLLANTPNTTRKPRENLPSSAPVLVSTSTSAPTDVATPVPSSTPVPANTATPVPTNTSAPTDTPVPPPTDTPIPPPTDTPVPPPTDTPVPVVPTDTAVSLPADTPAPPVANLVQPSNTTVPPTDAPISIPTDTPVPAQP